MLGFGSVSHPDFEPQLKCTRDLKCFFLELPLVRGHCISHRSMQSLPLNFMLEQQMEF